MVEGSFVQNLWSFWDVEKLEFSGKETKMEYAIN